MKSEPFSYTDVQGRRIDRIIDCDKQFKKTPVYTVAPDSSKLFNFDVKGGEYDLIILDPYGDEGMSNEMKRKIFLMDDYVLAIDRNTGVIYMTTFWDEGIEGISLVITCENPNVPNSKTKVPKKYRSRLDELKSSKRPFSFSVKEENLFHVVEREEGYQHLRENTVLTLFFNRRYLQIYGNSYREISPWKDRIVR